MKKKYNKKTTKELESFKIYFIVEKLYEIARKISDNDISLQLLVLGKMLEENLLKVKSHK
ncbi:MAG: hypothetical protein ACPLZ9_06800 [Candidatus Ratteibacteria bacterium]